MTTWGNRQCGDAVEHAWQRRSFSLCCCQDTRWPLQRWWTIDDCDDYCTWQEYRISTDAHADHLKLFVPSSVLLFTVSTCSQWFTGDVAVVVLWQLPKVEDVGESALLLHGLCSMYGRLTVPKWRKSTLGQSASKLQDFQPGPLKKL